MRITDILTEDLVLTGLPGDSKDDILEAMIDLVAKSPKVTDREKVRTAIFDREQIMSTGVGNGAPHRKTEGCRHRRCVRRDGTADRLRLPRREAGPLVFSSWGSARGPHIGSEPHSRLRREEFRNRLLECTPRAGTDLFRQKRYPIDV
jgi:deoxycytidylate deaminase